MAAGVEDDDFSGLPLTEARLPDSLVQSLARLGIAYEGALQSLTEAELEGLGPGRGAVEALRYGALPLLEPVVAPEVVPDVMPEASEAELTPEEILGCLIAGEEPYTGRLIRSGPLVDDRVREALVLALDALDGRDKAEPLAFMQALNSALPEGSKERSGVVLGPSVLETEQLWRNGRDPDEIAKERGLTLSTVYGHLGKLVQARRVDYRDLLSEWEERTILEVAAGKSGKLTVYQLARALDGYFDPAEIAFALNHHGLPVLYAKSG